MKFFIATLGILCFSGVAFAAEFASWADYAKANRYKCPGPLDTLRTPRTLTFADKPYKHSGYKLEVQKKDADSSIKIGLIGAIKDVSEGTQKNLKETFAWFRGTQVEWVVVNGDVALEESDLEHVFDLLAQEKLPTIVVMGNGESRGSWARVFTEHDKRYPNLINGVWVRQIVADDVEFWTLPGYFDRKFVYQGAGCYYEATDLEVFDKLSSDRQQPVALISHGPPKGEGAHALDWILDKKNVGDLDLRNLLEKKNISFGFFGHILEAGGAAVGRDFKTPIAPGKSASTLYINAGTLSADPWTMNDGSTGTGIATLVTIDGSAARYEFKKFKF